MIGLLCVLAFAYSAYAIARADSLSEKFINAGLALAALFLGIISGITS